jgi:hypothetical protein
VQAEAGEGELGAQAGVESGWFRRGDSRCVERRCRVLRDRMAMLAELRAGGADDASAIEGEDFCREVYS